MSLMKFADGFSEVRPENFLTVFAGILFGPAGALGCAIGNLITDLFFGGYGITAIFGLIMNFLVAYIPYKLWNAVNGRRLHVHSWKNLFLHAGTDSPQDSFYFALYQGDERRRYHLFWHGVYLLSEQSALGEQYGCTGLHDPVDSVHCGNLMPSLY